MTTLLDAVRRYAGAHAAEGGLAQTPIPGLTTVRATAPSGLMHAISRPLVCLVLQGAKRVTMGAQSFDFAAGDSLLITADVPTVSQITRASVAAPYLSLVLELDPAVVTDLAIQMKAVLVGSRAPVRADPTDTEAADAALRLMRLLDRPAAVPLLGAQLVRELHYWLLAGRHGNPASRLAGQPGAWAGAGGRASARGVCQAAASRATGVDGWHEPLGLPRPFPCGHLVVAASVPEAAPSHRGAPADAVGRRERQQRCLCRRL
jgi:hypothetical protein